VEGSRGKIGILERSGAYLEI
jgi:hypothetical protein